MELGAARKKLFYGWVIVAAETLVMMTVYGVINNCYAFYIEPVTSALGFSRQGYSLSQSLIFVGMVAMAPFVGPVYRRFDLMKAMRVSIVALTLCYAGYGLCSRLWQFYILSVIIGMAQCFVTTIPISIITRNWFHRSYGLALGVALMGSGVGGMVFSPVIHSLSASVGWRSTFFIVALIIGIVCFAAIFLIIKAEPKDKGLEPLHDPGAAAAAEQEELTGAPLGNTLRSPRFYIMLLFSMVFALGSYALCTFIAPYYSELGHPEAAITLCSSAAMGGMALGKIAFGRIMDKCGLKRSTLLSVFCCIIGFIGMLFSMKLYMFALVLVGVSLGCPFGTVAPAMIVREMFGSRDFGAKLGFYSAAANLGAAISPFFGGVIYDATGGYREAMAILLGVNVLLFLGYMLAIPGKAKRAGEI